jgi:hypothetical protein
MAAAKATMKMLGVGGSPSCTPLQLISCYLDVGPARLPNSNLTSEQFEKLRADLEALGFFQWVL